MRAEVKVPIYDSLFFFSGDKMSKKDEKNLANSIGLKEIDTENAISKIARDILRSMYRNEADLSQSEAELNRKIERVYEEWTGAKWESDNDKVLSVLLLGPPGQGKTTAFKEASKKVAAALGLKFKQNPGDEEKIGPDDFLFVTQEFSGENSIVSLGGIPAKTEEEGVEYMTKLVNKRLAMARRAGGALLLLDDFPNAAPNVQNVGLSLTDEKRFQGLNLDHVYVGLTGNLGALDGTHTTRLSTALRGRCVTYFTQDSLPNWITRNQQKYRDAVGTAGVESFLLREDSYFADMPSTKQSGGFPSPRTWDHFLISLRRSIRDHGGRGRGELRALPEIEELASSILGLEVGMKFHAFFNSLMLGADPLARQMIQDGVFDKKKFDEKFKDGFSAEAQHFAYQYAMALADYAVQDIVASKNFSLDLDSNKRLRQTIERFATGIMPVNPDTFAFTIDHFKAKLANQVDEWSTKFENRRVLMTDVKKVFVRVISESKEFTADHRQVLIDSMSDIDKYDASSRRRSRRS